MRIVSVDEHETFHYSAGHAEISGQIRLFERPRKVRFTPDTLRCVAVPRGPVRHVASFTPQHAAVRYGTRCYFNVRSKADISQLNLPHSMSHTPHHAAFCSSVHPLAFANSFPFLSSHLFSSLHPLP